MFQIRIHGRGGQGVVTAAEMLSIAAFLEGRYAQAFPTFGSERTGAPIMAFCRIDDREIRVREPIVRPDALIVQDATLLGRPGLFAGLNPRGYVLINSARGLAELGLTGPATAFLRERLLTVPATELALKHLGRPVPNAVLLGAFSAMSGVVSLESVQAAVRQKFSGRTAERNVAAAADAHAYVLTEMALLAGPRGHAWTGLEPADA
ncbi:2-oxoacid:acceptor oxidoreductase family protein [Sphaerisporangium dianthi]|uniref:2-oxoacid:acceptor oxidoreductase family protein n=1 Tax=Sphaerisporangium dianthi TaxID=1436120 RepID=A0ABV9CJZ0_9ACTN